MQFQPKPAQNGGYARSCLRGRIDRLSTNGLGGGSGVVESWPSVRVEHVESSGVGDAAEVGALLSVRTFVSLGGAHLTPDDVHVQVLYGKIDSNVLDRGTFGYTMREIPRNDLLTSVAEPGIVAVA